MITQQESQMREMTGGSFLSNLSRACVAACTQFGRKPQQSLKIVLEEILMRQTVTCLVFWVFFLAKGSSARDIVPLSNVFTPLKNVGFRAVIQTVCCLG